MAFRIFIVDDEPIIRRGLSETIPWGEHGIEVAGIAQDGEEAVEKLRNEEPVDLVITDIRMPHMDGLELAGYLIEHYPSIRIIVLSGYEEFSYAQQAMQLGVKDYLLKPVDVNELLHIVVAIQKQVKEEKSEKLRMYETTIKNALYLQLMEPDSRMLNSALEGMSLFPFITLAVSDDLSFEKPRRQIKREWKEGVEAWLSQKGVTSVSLFTEENVLLTCIIQPDSPDVYDWKNLTSSLNVQTASSFRLLFSEQKTNGTSIYKHYLRLVTAFLKTPVSQSESVMEIEENSSYEDVISLPGQLEQTFIQAVLQMDEKAKEQAVHQLFSFFLEGNYSLEQSLEGCRRVISGVLNQYERSFHKIPADLELYFTKDLDPTLYNTLSILQVLMNKDIEHLIEQLEIKKSQNKDWLMDRAEDYIKTYASSDIKAHEVADYINISPNYFSSLFKQATGQTFNEYVNGLRIEEAKALLAETPFKVNEIAAQVGYKEYKYFVEVFKKMCGVTPTIYRKMLSEKQ